MRTCRYLTAFLFTIAAYAQLQPARIFIVVGPPGSGKSVQAKILSKKFRVPAVSMESLLKQEMGRNTPLARALATSLSSGELISDEAANEVMKARLLRSDAGRGFILDGYPGTPDQAAAFDAYLKDHNFPKPMVIVLDVPDSLLRDRMKSRKRADDTPETIDRRIQDYRRLEMLSVDRYANAVRVDGTGSVQAVAARITNKIDTAQSSKELRVRPPTP